MAEEFDEELIQEFVEESCEHLDGVEDDLLAIEEGGADIDEELVNKVFRAIHTVKGGSGFLGLTTIKNLSHVQEHLMNLIRSRELVPSTEIINALLKGVDRLRQLVEGYETSNEQDVAELIALLERVAGAEPSETATEDKAEVAARVLVVKDSNKKPVFDIQQSDWDDHQEKGEFLYLMEVDVKQADAKPPVEVLEELRRVGVVAQTNPLEENITADLPDTLYVLIGSVLEPDMFEGIAGTLATSCRHLSEFDFEDDGEETVVADHREEDAKPVEAASTPAEVTPAQKPAADDSSAAKKASATKKPVESNVRVQLKTLNELMSLAGELVLIRNQMKQRISDNPDAGFESLVQRVDQVTSDLQMSIMSTRMQPIGHVFNKFKRIVRDLSQGLSKDIELKIVGESVELDRTIIESIGDPLTHLVRNSVDHGIGLPAERQAAGKPAQGTLELHAFHEAGQVIIEIIDDGKGIDPERIKAKALANDHYDPAVINEMSDRELVRLIFDPGFSLAEKVTDISGRGVGMDVVNSNFTKLGGTVDIESALGIGTKMRIKLPLTLAIMPSLQIRVENEFFAMPQVNMVELVRLMPDKIKDFVQKMGDTSVLRLRDKLLPLIRLADVLGIEQRTFVHPDSEEAMPEQREGIEDRRSKELTSDGLEAVAEESEQREQTDRRKSYQGAMNIMIVTAGDFDYGLIVDGFEDSAEIVVKPLGKHLKDCHCYAGATIRGDGRVSLILDVVGISEKAELASIETADTKHDQELQALAEKESLLLVKNSATEQFCVPLNLIKRIERINKEQIEDNSGQASIQYRGGSLALFNIEQAVNVGPCVETDDLSVLVFVVGHKEVGLIVSEVLDVVDFGGEFDEMTFKQQGIMGSAIINKETTLMLDLYGIVTHVHPDWDTDVRQTVASEKTGVPRILVVDDSKFYRNQIKKYVKKAGCEVVTAEDGIEALAAVEQAEDRFDLILTDIEMPNMNGLEFTRQVRQNDQYRDSPIVAITSLAGDANERNGYDAGVSSYMVKLDRDKLLEILNQYVF